LRILRIYIDTIHGNYSSILYILDNYKKIREYCVLVLGNKRKSDHLDGPHIKRREKDKPSSLDVLEQDINPEHKLSPDLVSDVRDEEQLELVSDEEESLQDTSLDEVISHQESISEHEYDSDVEDRAEPNSDSDSDSSSDLDNRAGPESESDSDASSSTERPSSVRRVSDIEYDSGSSTERGPEADSDSDSGPDTEEETIESLRAVLSNVERARELSENTPSDSNPYLDDLREEFSSIFEENNDNNKQALDEVKNYIEEQIENIETLESLSDLSILEEKESKSSDSDESESSGGSDPTGIGPSNTENSSDSESSSNFNSKTSLNMKGYVLFCLSTLGEWLDIFLEYFMYFF
jgi:hypothetical protein